MFKGIKEKINEFKEAYKETTDSSDTIEKQEQREIKNEIIDEYGDEIKLVGKLALAGSGILVVGIAIIILIRPLISGGVNELIDSNSSNGNNNGQNNNLNQNIDCSKPYDAMYVGGYGNYNEQVGLSSDGSFNMLINNSESSIGTYTISNNILTATIYDGDSITYTISSDCTNLVRNDNSNIVLKVE